MIDWHWLSTIFSNPQSSQQQVSIYADYSAAEIQRIIAEGGWLGLERKRDSTFTHSQVDCGLVRECVDLCVWSGICQLSLSSLPLISLLYLQVITTASQSSAR